MALAVQAFLVYAVNKNYRFAILNYIIYLLQHVQISWTFFSLIFYKNLIITNKTLSVFNIAQLDIYGNPNML